MEWSPQRIDCAYLIDVWDEWMRGLMDGLMYTLMYEVRYEVRHIVEYDLSVI